LKTTLIRAAAAVLCLTALPWNAHPKARGGAAAAVTPAGARIEVASAGISPDVLQLALGAVNCATRLGDIEAPRTLTIIDYSRPSVEQRLWVFDMRDGNLLFKELVAHGRNTGENMATQFSDTMNSRQSSIGLFVTADTYVGDNGYSLRLDGLERGFNAKARERAIVMHGAPYVDAKLAASEGRIGRSWGCPALREAVARQVIDTIRGGGVIFSYYPDSNWLKSSRFLHGCGSV
jgi:L,D-transpeptidase catalytic domain